MTTQIEKTTKEFRTSGGHVLVIYEYITGREKRQIESIIFDTADIKGNKNDVDIKMGGMSKAIDDMKDRAIGILVKEIKTTTGEVITLKNDILSFILDLPEKQYTEIINEINSITDPKKEPATS